MFFMEKMKGIKKTIAILLVFLMISSSISFIFVSSSPSSVSKNLFSESTRDTSKEYNDTAPLLTYFHDDFESNFSKNWEYWDDEPLSGYDYWGISSYRRKNGNYSAYCAQINDTSGQVYDDDMKAYLIRNETINASLWTYANLSFSVWYDTDLNPAPPPDHVSVVVSPDNGSTWDEFVQNWSGQSNGWIDVYQEIDTTYLTSQMKIGFYFWSGPNAATSYQNEGVYVDNVSLTYKEEVLNITFDLPEEIKVGETCKVTAHVTDPTGNPVEGVYVRFYDNSNSTPDPPVLALFPQLPPGYTDENGNYTSLYSAPLFETKEIIGADASKPGYSTGYATRKTINITMPLWDAPYRVLIVDPYKDPNVVLGNYLLGWSKDRFWIHFEENYSDVETLRISPTDDLQSVLDDFSSANFTCIMLSDNIIKHWELNENGNFQALRNFSENGKGIIVTHGTYFDGGVPGSDFIIGSSHHSGIYENNGQYDIDFNYTLSVETGLGLFPIYEAIKLNFSNIIESLGEDWSSVASTAIENAPLNIPYVPFNQTLNVSDPNDPIFDGINISNGSLKLDLDKDKNYTSFGWQLEYPELIIYWALQWMENSLNKTKDDFEKYILHQRNDILNETENATDLMNETQIQEYRRSLQNGYNLTKDLFYGLYEARLGLPNISVYLPSVNITNPFTGENIHINETMVNITLPPEVAEKICKLLKPAKISAISVDKRAAILEYESPTHKSVYFTFKPESSLHPISMRLVYNAIKWVSNGPKQSYIIRNYLDVPKTVMENYTACKDYAISNNASYIAHIQGFVTQSGISEGYIEIKNTSYLLSFISFPHENISFSLISPSNIAYNATNYGDHTLMIEINCPESGIWTYKIWANNLSDSQIELYNLEFWGNKTHMVIPIKTGWNMITLPWQTTPIEVGNALPNISWDRSMAYVNGTWYTYNKNRDSKYNLGFPKITNKLGIWVHAIENGTISGPANDIGTTQIFLHKGWNLVGYPTGNGTRKVEDALNGIPWDYVQNYDDNTNKIITLASTDYMKIGGAYWIHVKEDAVWSVKW